jgi:hypothetical protein
MPPSSRELGGWRAGRNPPSVRGDICLIGIPAPQTALMGAYYPFHNAGRRFTLTISLLDVFASLSLTDAGFLSVSSPGLSPDVSRRRASVLWVEFPQAEARKSPTGSPTILSYAICSTQELLLELTVEAKAYLKVGE